MYRKTMLIGCVFAAVLLSASPLSAGENIEDLKEQVRRLNQRLEKIESEKTRRIEKEELAGLMKEILDEAQATPALPDWMRNLTFYGDFRLRFEHQTFQGRQGGGTTVANPRVGEPKDRNRIRMRLRFGFTKTWWDDQMEVGFRLCSGDNSPTGANQTMTGDFSKKPIWIDLMYAKYKPNWAKGLEVGGGKVLNPIKTRTMITWDSGLNPEGIYMDYVAPFFGEFKPYAQMGFWMVNENGTRSAAGMNTGATLRDTVMFHQGAGFEWKFMDALEWFFGMTYYEYKNVGASTGGFIGRYGPDGQWADNGLGGQTPTQNAAAATQAYAAADFRQLELTTKVGWKLAFLPTPLQKWMAWFTFVHNFEDDYNVWNNPTVPALGGIGADRHFKNDPNAYAAGFQVGENSKKNDISIAYACYYIEYGSVAQGFGDGALGGPNSKGHLLQAIYNIDDFLTVGGTMILFQPIHTNDNPANANNANAANGPAVLFPHSQDLTATFRLELVWKF
ncbi:MAG: putative porin [Phycisphaerae bacterium]|nr:putative porin [Phycisphaerae bacterium]